ncbi:exocyst complex component Sec5-domain-containing protein [Phycomyces nitens]|nr:exocyst complex component Sec5-domain-containing protein [Phycomyces nitens]
MESEMDRLNESMNSLNRQSTTINEALGPNRDKIQQLSRAHNQLKRLQFIFDLPNRLSRCLSKGQLAQAVKYYARAAQLLDHYKHMAAFKGIEQDCQTIMAKVKSEIENKMRKEDNIEDIAENIRLLILLKEDLPALRQNYLELQLSVIEKNQTEPITLAEELVDAYIVPLDKLVKHYMILFVEDDQDSQPKSKQVNLSRAIQPSIDRFFELAANIIALPALVEKGSCLSAAVAMDKQMTQVAERWENELVNRFLCTVVSGMKGKCLQEDIDQSSFAERVSNGLNEIHILCLVSSRLCFDFADHIITRIYSEFSRRSPNPSGRQDSIDTIFTSDCQELGDLFSQTGQFLLNNQIMEDGYALSAKIQTHYLSLQSSPPTEPSGIWKEVFGRLQSVEQLVNIAFPQPTPPIQATHSSQSLATMSSGTGEPLGKVSKFGNDVTLNMMHTIHKLFEDRVDVYRPIEPSAVGACEALCRILLKALQEVVREMWVDCNIYQQLQVDVEYLGIALRSYAGDEK